MSGHKLSTLRIQKAASSRLARRRMRKALREEQAKNRSEYLHDQYIADMGKVFQDIEARQSLFADSIDQFQSRTLQRLEQENNEVLLASQASLFEDMQGVLTHIWLERDESISNSLDQSLTILEDQHIDIENYHEHILDSQAANREETESLSRQFNDYQQRVANVFHDFEIRQSENASNQQHMFQQVQDFIQQQEELGRFQDSKEEIVQKQLSDAQALYDFVTTTFKHEKFTPGETQRAVYEMDKTRQNLELGFLDAAMINAQQAYQSLSEQRVNLQQKQAEWEVLHLDVENRLRQLLIDAEELEEIPSVDLDGKEIGQMIDVDYWSSRRLSRLKTMIHTLLDRVENQPDKLQIEDLLIIQNTEIPQIFEELENTCNIAMEEVLNSQLRVNIADIVIQALENQGFCFAESEYQHNDQRKAFSANVINLAGDEIIINVEPNKEEPGSSNLHLISADAEQRSEHELHQRAKEIFGTLNQFGLENGTIQVLPIGLQEANHQQGYKEAIERQHIHLKH